MTRRLFTFVLAAWCLAFPLVLQLHSQEAQRRAIQVDDLFRLQRLASPEISPDGQWVAYVSTSVNVENNKSISHLWMVASDGKSPPRQLTTSEKRDLHPRWSPDGQWLLFESNRSGSMQLWAIRVAGGEARRLTNLASEAGSATWSPDGKQIAFVSAVWPEFSKLPFQESQAAHQKRVDDQEKNPVKARVFTRLFFRHWDSYVEDKRQHLFVMSFDDGTAGEPRDVTPGDRDAFPTSSTFSGAQDYTFSPDGQHLVYTAPPFLNEAWSTNYDLWRVSVAGGVPECLTTTNLAADGQPRFSPDGKKLAYRAMRRPGFEADRWELMVVDCDASGKFTGKPESVSKEFDASVEDFFWQPDGKGFVILAEQKGEIAVLRLTLDKGEVTVLDSTPGVFGSMSMSQDGKTLAFAHSSAQRPMDIYVSRETAPGTSQGYLVTQANAGLLNSLQLPALETVTIPGDGGTPMQMWLLKPPGFDDKKKWPLIYLVHGGPQSAWMNGWSWRWNPQIWAAQGYVVALPNPRGSTGFGQKYVDEISGDWGGKCYRDLMAGVDYLEKQPYIDASRMAAAGASFGGYMMNWFQGNTTKFKTLVCHCGVYNHDSMYTTTEELWFDEWDHGEGKPIWENREKYLKHSPHLLAKNFKTPMLIIHNDLDFRVPVSQGIELFTTLQRLGIASRFINFPDEGHWVLKPANSRYWHNEIFAWLRNYTPPGGR